MKKLFFFAFFAVAIASFGVHSTLAHAQTAPAGPVSSATLEQELQVAKATLVNLEMKAGIVPAGDSGLPGGSATPIVPAPTVSSVVPTTSSGLSATDRAALQSALGSLVSALSSLNATIAANPQAVTSHEQAIALLLGGMRNTVVSMGNALNGTPIAAAAPSRAQTPSTGTNAPTVAQSPTPSTPAPIASTQPAPTTGVLNPTAPAAGASGQNQAQTAQASNAWSFVVDHWPTITIIVLVALILLILFWPSKDAGDEQRNSHKPVAKQQGPSRPSITVSQSSQSTSTQQPATPVATAVGAPSKVTVIRPQGQERKTA